MNTAPLLTIIGVVLVLVLFLVGMPRRGKQWRLRGLDEGNAARVGRLGEIKTVAATRLILSSSEYIDINDITITTPRGTTQIDHVIVSRYGVFVVETKNMNGWIFGREDARFWTKLNKGHKLRFQNPLHQNANHIKALSHAARIPPEKMHSVVVFQGDCSLRTSMPPNVLTDGYIGYVKSKSKVVFTDDEVKRIVATINAVMLPQTDATRLQHIANLKQRFESTTTCGRCGSPLVTRTTKAGRHAGKQFLGCSRYPSCQYVRELK
jgi:restriction system protein